MYKIRYVGCHKPWRHTYEWLIDDKDMFEFFKEQEDRMFDELEFPESDERDDYSIWDYLQENIVEAEYPYLLEGELTFYGE